MGSNMSQFWKRIRKLGVTPDYRLSFKSHAKHRLKLFQNSSNTLFSPCKSEAGIAPSSLKRIYGAMAPSRPKILACNLKQMATHLKNKNLKWLILGTTADGGLNELAFLRLKSRLRTILE